MQKKWIADAWSHKEDLNERLQSTLKKNEFVTETHKHG